MTMTADVLYLYALTPNEGVALPADGLGRGVDAIACKGWTAVVDTVSRDAWTGPGADERLQQLAWVGPRACAHEEVIEAIMEQGAAVYPARFGTLFTSASDLRTVVQAHRDTLSAFFERVDGAEEWSVKGYLDRQKALAHRASSSDASSAASGTSYLKQRRREQHATAELDDWLSDLSRSLWETLGGTARHLSERPAGPSSPDAPVFHWAALVSCTNRSAFLQTVDTLRERHAAEGLRLDPSGPWPPYTFRDPLPDASSL
jgi:hypothetical protein